MINKAAKLYISNNTKKDQALFKAWSFLIKAHAKAYVGMQTVHISVPNISTSRACHLRRMSSIS